jgi:hypothetical protein
MSTQPEQTLENNLIAQLENLGFEDNKKSVSSMRLLRNF